MATYASKTLRPRQDDIFFAGMAILILGTVFLGFARSYYLAGVFQAPLPNLLIHLHGAVFSAWILLLAAQTSLISAGRLDMHRRLGMLGAGLAAAMVVLGILSATDALARGFVPPGSNLDPKTFYAIPFLQTVFFCVLIVGAMRARADGPAHKRLILIATIPVMGPAVNRWPYLRHTLPILTLAIVDSFVPLVAGFDLWSRRRMHPATLRGGLFLIIFLHLMFPIGQTAFWHHFTNLALNVWKCFR
jgi:hypothetical protein